MLSMHWTFRHLPLVYWELALDFCLGMVLVTVLEFIFDHIKAGLDQACDPASRDNDPLIW